ncbi:hypothetical protein ACIVBQ_000946 [Tenacibaculum discolor]
MINPVNNVAEIPLSVLYSCFQEIRKLNYYISIFLLFFCFFVLITTNLTIQNIVAFVLDGFTYVFLVSLVQLEIFKFCVFKYRKNRKTYKVVRNSLSILSALIIHFITFPIFLYFSGFEVEFFSLQLLFTFILEALILTALIYFMHNFILLRVTTKHRELEYSKLQIRSVEAKNLLLKQQIQPHFFFNSLNTLKAIYKKDLDIGESYLIYLADFMRSVVSNHNYQVASIKEELQMCTNYLMMQKIRFGGALECVINFEEEKKKNWFIPFFSIQPLIENAIKHNSFTLEKPLLIQINQKENYLIIENTLSLKKFKEKSIQTGLINLSERYRIWCGEELIITQTESCFSVKFKIFEREDINY